MSAPSAPESSAISSIPPVQNRVALSPRPVSPLPPVKPVNHDQDQVKRQGGPLPPVRGRAPSEPPPQSESETLQDLTIGLVEKAGEPESRARDIVAEYQRDDMNRSRWFTKFWRTVSAWEARTRVRYEALMEDAIRDNGHAVYTAPMLADAIRAARTEMRRDIIRHPRLLLRLIVDRAAVRREYQRGFLDAVHNTPPGTYTFTQVAARTALGRIGQGVRQVAAIGARPDEFRGRAAQGLIDTHRTSLTGGELGAMQTAEGTEGTAGVRELHARYNTGGNANLLTQEGAQIVDDPNNPVRRDFLNQVVVPVLLRVRAGNAPTPVEMQQILRRFVDSHGNDPVIQAAFGRNIPEGERALFATDLLAQVEQINRRLDVSTIPAGSQDVIDRLNAVDQEQGLSDEVKLQRKVDILVKNVFFGTRHWGVNTQEHRSLVDRTVNWIRRSPIPVTPEVVSVVIGASFLVPSLLREAGSRLPVIGLFVGAGVAGMRAKVERERDIATHRREAAQGRLPENLERHRRAVDYLRFDTVSARELITGSGTRQRIRLSAPGETERPEVRVTTPGLSSITNAEELAFYIAEIQARQQVGAAHNVDMIGFSSPTQVMTETQELTDAVNEQIARLNTMVPPQRAQELLTQQRNRWTANLEANYRRIATQERANVLGYTARQAVIGGVVGYAFGVAGQELFAELGRMGVGEAVANAFDHVSRLAHSAAQATTHAPVPGIHGVAEGLANVTGGVDTSLHMMAQMHGPTQLEQGVHTVLNATGHHDQAAGLYNVLGVQEAPQVTIQQDVYNAFHNPGHHALAHNISTDVTTGSEKGTEIVTIMDHGHKIGEVVMNQNGTMGGFTLDASANADQLKTAVQDLHQIGFTEAAFNQVPGPDVGKDIQTAFGGHPPTNFETTLSNGVTIHADHATGIVTITDHGHTIQGVIDKSGDLVFQQTAGLNATELHQALVQAGFTVNEVPLGHSGSTIDWIHSLTPDQQKLFGFTEGGQYDPSHWMWRTHLYSPDFYSHNELTMYIGGYNGSNLPPGVVAFGGVLSGNNIPSHLPNVPTINDHYLQQLNAAYMAAHPGTSGIPATDMVAAVRLNDGTQIFVPMSYDPSIHQVVAHLPPGLYDAQGHLQNVNYVAVGLVVNNGQVVDHNALLSAGMPKGATMVSLASNPYDTINTTTSMTELQIGGHPVVNHFTLGKMPTVNNLAGVSGPFVPFVTTLRNNLETLPATETYGAQTPRVNLEPGGPGRIHRLDNFAIAGPLGLGAAALSHLPHRGPRNPRGPRPQRQRLTPQQQQQQQLNSAYQTYLQADPAHRIAQRNNLLESIHATPHGQEQLRGFYDAAGDALIAAGGATELERLRGLIPANAPADAPERAAYREAVRNALQALPEDSPLHGQIDQLFQQMLVENNALNLAMVRDYIARLNGQRGRRIDDQRRALRYLGEDAALIVPGTPLERPQALNMIDSLYSPNLPADLPAPLQQVLDSFRSDVIAYSNTGNHQGPTLPTAPLINPDLTAEQNEAEYNRNFMLHVFESREPETLEIVRRFRQAITPYLPLLATLRIAPTPRERGAAIRDRAGEVAVNLGREAWNRTAVRGFHAVRNRVTEHPLTPEQSNRQLENYEAELYQAAERRPDEVLMVNMIANQVHLLHLAQDANTPFTQQQYEQMFQLINLYDGPDFNFAIPRALYEPMEAFLHADPADPQVALNNLIAQLPQGFVTAFLLHRDVNSFPLAVSLARRTLLEESQQNLRQLRSQRFEGVFPIARSESLPEFVQREQFVGALGSVATQLHEYLGLMQQQVAQDDPRVVALRMQIISGIAEHMRNGRNPELAVLQGEMEYLQVARTIGFIALPSQNNPALAVAQDMTRLGIPSDEANRLYAASLSQIEANSTVGMEEERLIQQLITHATGEYFAEFDQQTATKLEPSLQEAIAIAPTVATTVRLQEELQRLGQGAANEGQLQTATLEFMEDVATLDNIITIDNRVLAEWDGVITILNNEEPQEHFAVADVTDNARRRILNDAIAAHIAEPQLQNALARTVQATLANLAQRQHAEAQFPHVPTPEDLSRERMDAMQQRMNEAIRSGDIRRIQGELVNGLMEDAEQGNTESYDRAVNYLAALNPEIRNFILSQLPNNSEVGRLRDEFRDPNAATHLLGQMSDEDFVDHEEILRQMIGTNRRLNDQTRQQVAMYLGTIIPREQAFLLQQIGVSDRRLQGMLDRFNQARDQRIGREQVQREIAGQAQAIRQIAQDRGAEHAARHLVDNVHPSRWESVLNHPTIDSSLDLGTRNQVLARADEIRRDREDRQRPVVERVGAAGFENLHINDLETSYVRELLRTPNTGFTQAEAYLAFLDEESRNRILGQLSGQVRDRLEQEFAANDIANLRSNLPNGIALQRQLIVGIRGSSRSVDATRQARLVEALAHMDITEAQQEQILQGINLPKGKNLERFLQQVRDARAARQPAAAPVNA